ncbi:hypothetical protein HGH93_26645 [Chitinophaga polysaccharea]|uniref:hypothetical protein n=1 Tax=Chitinophaga polysaccharea TaxID=1293035 RepID=UPI00145513F5|nr:hypothetical protein [Chitinophaga polysaccharea]NLR61710.1 hypothetical protein [Chitinophaga polysaccharea]
MNKLTNIQNELMQIAPGVNWPAKAPFAVPAGYFEQLPAAIIMQIQLEELRSVMPAPQDIPIGYFNALPATILQLIKAKENINPVQTELETLSPFLATIPRKDTLSVPDDYFASLQPGRHIPVVSPIRVVHRNKVSTWMKWTVAACLTLFIGSSAILFIVNNNYHNTSIEKQLEDLNDQDIVQYLQTHTDSFDNDAVFASSAAQEVSPVQHQLSEDVPLDAIEKYLLQTDLSKEVLPDKK